MQNFKIAVSKDGKKYTIVMKAENQAVARERVHKEGYSILSLEEVFDKHEIGDTFVFEGYKGGEFKHGKIVGNDIFKAYVKLRKDLEYDISLLYSEKDEKISYDEKIKIIEELKEEFEITFSLSKSDKKIEEKKEKSLNKNNIDNKLNNFYLKKELEDVNILLEKVLEKLEKMISGKYFINIDSLKKDKLKIIYNEIIKLKKTTNISKLREVGELALLKIGKIEIDELEKNKSNESKALLGETNKLLKKIGSKTHFIEKEKDLGYQFNYIMTGIKNFFSDFKGYFKKDYIDKESHSYVKTLLYLSKYKYYYKENTKSIIKNFYKIPFDINLREDLFLSRSVIKQNIILLKAKEKGVSISYTYLKKGFFKITEKILNLFSLISNILFLFIMLYVIFFIVFLNFYGFFSIKSFNYDGIFYFIIISFLYFLIKTSKNIFIFIINFVILFFIIIFGVINF